MVIRVLRPIYETFKQASKKGGGATPDEIINWFKKNRPKRVETIMGMNISNARDAYSNAKTAFKRSQKVSSVDKPLGAGG